MNRYRAFVLLLAVLLLGALPAAAADRPFSLSSSGTVINGVVHSSGRATHLGLFTENGALSLSPDPENPTRFLATGQATFTAANGDVLNVQIVDAFLDVTTGLGAGVYQFAGGTGRFEEATGTGNFVVNQNLITGAFELTAVGTINY